MKHNPDIYLLYEYMDKLPFTLRIKVRLDEQINPSILNEIADEAFSRFPYFSVQVGLDENENYTIEHNDRPIRVLPEEDKRLVLGSDELNKHLFVITYKDDCIWFSGSHSFCGAFGIFFWIKTTLYLYMCKKYGMLKPPLDIKLPNTPVTEEETFFPDPDTLPTDEPVCRYDGGDSNYAIGRMIFHLLNPFAKDNYYYEINIPSKEFMEYAKSVDGSPYTVLTSMMYKAMTRLFKEKEGTHISARIAADYRDDIGAGKSYRDFVRFIHVKYDWGMKDEPISKLNMRARGAMISQNQPELGYERFRKLIRIHNGIDEQPDLKQKIKYAKKNSTFRSDPRDVYTISYVGQIDYGEMEEHIKGVYTITDGDLMLEVNALKDCFNICFQVVNKDRKPLELFLKILEEEKIPYTLSDRQIRYMPRLKLQ